MALTTKSNGTPNATSIRAIIVVKEGTSAVLIGVLAVKVPTRLVGTASWNVIAKAALLPSAFAIPRIGGTALDRVVRASPSIAIPIAAVEATSFRVGPS